MESDTNPFRYCGEYYDKETGTIYLRARSYDPSIGRFISRDSFTGKIEDPLSLNLYTYCHNNPVLYVDENGHWPKLSSILTGVAITAVVVAVAAVVVVTAGAAAAPLAAAGGAIISSSFAAGAVTVGTTVGTYAAVTAGVAGVGAISAYAIEENVSFARERSKNPIAKRKRYSSKKEAYENAKKAGKGNKPIHHPDGDHGPHYHPDVPMPKNQTPKAPNPHDHYFYPKGK